MNYLHSRLFDIQLISQLGLCVLLFLLPESFHNSLLFLLSGILLATLGIPHGANDFLYRKDKSVRGSIVFLSVYLGVMGLYVIVWYFSGAVALLLFFIITVFHFGQANFEEHRVLNAESLLWGALLLIWPVAFSPGEAFDIFSSMSGTTFPLYYGRYLIYLGAGLTAIYLVLVWKRRKTVFLRLVVQMALIILWFYLTPLIPGFIVVFSLWHGLQSMVYQHNYFMKTRSNTKKAKILFWKNMLVFSLISLAFLGAYLYFFGFDVGSLFILLSLITLPHVFVMHSLYIKTHRTIPKNQCG